jgi:hypothetical protein
LLQSKDVGERCFFPADAKKWLSECEYWPDNYFDLWDIYEKYSSELSRKNAEKLHSEKNENGKSIHAVKTGTTSFCNKTGIHDPLYRNSAEYKIINTLAGEKGGQEGVRRRSGIHDPNYRSSGTYLEMRSEVGKKMAERRAHDGTQRRLFAHVEILKMLVEGFVPPEVIAGLELDLDRAEQMSGKFISHGLAVRESDMLWKIPRRDGAVGLYICILLEFQSSVDPVMPIRIMQYVSFIYENMARADGFKLGPNTLPPVLPAPSADLKM